MEGGERERDMVFCCCCLNISLCVCVVLFVIIFFSLTLLLFFLGQLVCCISFNHNREERENPLLSSFGLLKKNKNRNRKKKKKIVAATVEKEKRETIFLFFFVFDHPLTMALWWCNFSLVSFFIFFSFFPLSLSRTHRDINSFFFPFFVGGECNPLLCVLVAAAATPYPGHLLTRYHAKFDNNNLWNSW